MKEKCKEGNRRKEDEYWKESREERKSLLFSIPKCRLIGSQFLGGQLTLLPVFYFLSEYSTV
jgi:hypothetical protein